MPIFVAVAVGVLGAAAPDDDRPRPGRRSASRPRGRATPGCRSTGCVGAGLPALGAGRQPGGRSSTSPTSARPRPTPAPATSWRRSRPSCSAGRRSSAAAAASPARCWACFAIAVLQNGLRLADLPAELAGVLTGTLAAGCDRTGSSLGQRSRRAATHIFGGFDREELASGRDLRRHPGGGADHRGRQLFPGPARSRASAAGRSSPRQRRSRPQANDRAGRRRSPWP